jgi:hypothetical protein
LRDTQVIHSQGSHMGGVSECEGQWRCRGYRSGNHCMSGRPLSRKGEIGSADRSFAVMSTAFDCKCLLADHDEVRGSDIAAANDNASVVLPASGAPHLSIISRTLRRLHLVPDEALLPSVALHLKRSCQSCVHATSPWCGVRPRCIYIVIGRLHPNSLGALAVQAPN